MKIEIFHFGIARFLAIFFKLLPNHSGSIFWTPVFFILHQSSSSFHEKNFKKIGDHNCPPLVEMAWTDPFVSFECLNKKEKVGQGKKSITSRFFWWLLCVSRPFWAILKKIVLLRGRLWIFKVVPVLTYFDPVIGFNGSK